MKKMTFTFNGFHGRRNLGFNAQNDARRGGLVEVSQSVKNRLNRDVCGVSGCTCGEHVAVEEPPYSGRFFVFVPESGEMRGNYPQD